MLGLLVLALKMRLKVVKITGLIIIIALVLCGRGWAASVAWDVARCTYTELWGSKFYSVVSESPSPWYEMSFSVNPTQLAYVLTAYSFTPWEGWGVNAQLAKKGDVVSASTSTGNGNTYFYSSPLGTSEVCSDYDISISKAGETFYLALAIDKLIECDEEAGVYIGEKRYGWAELSVGSDGAVLMIRSAMDLDGDSIVVGYGGAVPEPSSGMLLVFGLAGLALRRRRKYER